MPRQCTDNPAPGKAQGASFLATAGKASGIIAKEFGWGYALWNFKGPSGIMEHGRPGAKFELIDGYYVDRALLDLMLDNRVGHIVDITCGNHL